MAIAALVISAVAIGVSCITVYNALRAERAARRAITASVEAERARLHAVLLGEDTE